MKVPLPSSKSRDGDNQDAPEPETVSQDFDFEQARALYPWIGNLNPPQAEAVVTTDGPVLMLAGAGTGKTSALTTRIAHLILTQKTGPYGLLAVTFTNRAALEMRERVQTLLGQDTGGWWLGTFHALGVRILRQNAGLVNLTSGFTILDSDDQQRLCKQLIRAENLDDKRWKARDLVALISRWKDRGLSPDKIRSSEIPDFADGKSIVLYQQYQEYLKRLNAVDFGDILLHNLDIFQSHPEILEKYQSRFRYILVDEYQDTNVAQYLWLRLLAGKHKNICCVGDDDQSIYGWRGAEVGNILRFEKDFTGAKIIRLEQNYRSHGAILKAASCLIKHNRERLDKTLWTADQDGIYPELLSCCDGLDEARRIGDKVGKLHTEKAVPLKEIAILVRASHVMRTFEEHFNAIGLAYRVIGGPRFYERAEVRDALAYLRLVHSLSDDLAFERIINVPKRGIGPSTIQKLRAEAGKRGLSLAETASLLVETEILPVRARQKVGAFLMHLNCWREKRNSSGHADLARQILDESGYTSMWMAEKTADAAGRLENLKELVSAMSEFDSLEGFLEHVSLVMETLSGNQVDMVNIMTLHSAKGLEFNTVFLPAWEEGLFPSQRSMDQNGLKGLEEERRLAYVGITRARQNLFISYAASRLVHGQYSTGIPSRFLGELPESYVKQDDLGTAFGIRGYSQNWLGAASQGFQLQGSGANNVSKIRTLGWQRAGKFLAEGCAKPESLVRASGAPGARVKAGGKQKKDSSRFEVGVSVFHQKFGYGQVMGVEEDKVDVDFESAGRKKLIASFLSLRPGLPGV